MATAQLPIQFRIKAAKDAVKEASENHIYWRRQAFIRTNPGAKAEAAGLASAWETTRTAREQKLHDLEALRP